MAPGTVDFLSGGGDAGGLMRGTDWSRTPLGPPAHWPQSLKTSVSICLESAFPVLLWWGPELVMLYNDAYRPILGDKHPRSMGQPGRECWPEIWGTIGPMLEAVLERAQASYFEDLMLPLRRRGFAEECYFTFTYSPIRDETGGVGGVFCAVTETTQRVIGERQLALLRELATHTAGARTFDRACAAAADCLARDPHDLTFSLLYLLDPERRRLTLAAASRAGPGQADLPDVIPLDRPCASPSAELVRAHAVRGSDRPATIELPASPAGPPPRRAVVVPLAPSRAGGRSGLLLAGLNPLRPLDDGYRRFLELVAAQLAASMANAQAYEDERRRADALAELDRAKTTFFSDVSHEFRTPLTLMLGPTEEALRTGSFAPDDLALLHRNELRLLKLVNTLLDFARIEAARVQVSFEPTDLAAATADLASTFRSAAERAGLRLVVDCPPLPAPVLVDREMWEKIVLNLLSNAFKYTLAGAIEVSLRWAGDHVELAVRDTGTGIPAAELPRIFERFHRVPAARGRSVEGSGIGLALVKELARLHGGAAAAESEPGKGTTVTIRVPTGDAHVPGGRIVAAPPRPAGAVVARPYVEEALRWLPGDARAPDVALEPLAARGDAGLPLAPAGAGRVLVVDDNADMRQYLSTLLRERWDVEAVPDGAAAEEAIRRRRPDLVLSDAMMPVIDGFALLRRLRSDPATREIPFILLSARAGEEARVEGVQAGADDYLVKPFAARELLARVATHLDLARIRREAEAARRVAEATLRGLFEATAALMTLVELREDDFVHVMPNARTATFFGRAVGEVDGRSGRELGLPADVVAQWVARFRACHAEQRALTVDYSVPRDGRDSWFHGTVSPVPAGPSGRPRFALVAVDVTDRKQAEVALRSADQRKTDFLAVLSHELRNPLAPIRNGLYLLERAPPGGPEALRAREVIRRQVDQVAKLVDDLLDISRINHGKIRLDRRILDARAVTRRACDDARAAFEQRGVALRLDVGADPLWVDADETRLAQIVGNLLSNAAKFTLPAGTVEVTLRRGGADTCELRVRDDGVGIEPHLLEEVFEPFAQAERTRGTARGGMGVGLALVRSLATLHGGAARACSEGAGRGAELVVSLPLAPGAALDAIPPARAAVPSLSILIVEDNVDAGETLADLLRLHDHEVRLATDGRAGVAAFAASRPDVLLCDVGLPDVTGYELIRQLRALDGGRSTFAVALTGYAQPADVQRAISAGFDAHLPKPPPLDELDRLLAHAASAREA